MCGLAKVRRFGELGKWGVRRQPAFHTATEILRYQLMKGSRPLIVARGAWAGMFCLLNVVPWFPWSSGALLHFVTFVTLPLRHCRAQCGSGDKLMRRKCPWNHPLTLPYPGEGEYCEILLCKF